ncbi:MAG: hypothetical protein ACKVWV_08730 [Planctomycetota bacterium]
MIATQLFLALAALAAPGAETVEIGWQGKAFTSKNLPDKLPPGAKLAVKSWESWAQAAGYRMDFDPAGRVLLLTDEDQSRAEKQMRVIEQASKWFDEVLPAPTRVQAAKPSPVATPAAAPQRDEIPEDPEAPAPVHKTPPQAPKQPTTWGAGTTEPDTQTAVMLVARKKKEFQSALDHIAKQEPYLAKWAESAKQDAGFVLETPLSGAYLEAADGQEEWDPNHELLNRVVQMLLLRRFGQQPNWVVQGVAWEGEIAFDEMVYCFPYRSEFVYTAEHGAWPNDVKNRFKDRAKKPVRMQEFAQWRRGTYVHETAQLSWGLCKFLLVQGSGKLSAMLEECRVAWDEKNRKAKPDGTWERSSDFLLPVDVQHALLKKHFGESVLQDATAWLRTQESVKK